MQIQIYIFFLPKYQLLQKNIEINIRINELV